MRIGFFADQYMPVTDGVISSMVNARQGLTELGHEVYFVIPRYKGPKRHKNDVLIDALPVPTHKNIRIMRPGQHDIQRIKDLNLDVIHSHNQFASGRMAFRLSKELGVPHVTTMHTLFPEWIAHYPLLSYLFLAPIKYYLSEQVKENDLRAYNPDLMIPVSSKHKALVSTAWRHTGAFCDATDYVITPSEHVARKLRRLGVTQEIEAVPNGVDLSKFSSGKISKSKPLKLVFVGRLSREKRQAAVIRALKHLGLDDVELTLIGDGPAKPELKLLAQKLRLSNVRFAGHMDPNEVRKALPKFDAGILASYRFDTQGLVLVEYMASGLPVIYCDPNLNEVVGTGAALLADTDEESLAKAIRALADSATKREKMSKAALKQSKRYSHVEVARQMEKIYSGLINS